MPVAAISTACRSPLGVIDYWAIKECEAGPLEFREAFVLREIEGLDYRAIAEVTATPLGTVMSRLARLGGV